MRATLHTDGAARHGVGQPTGPAGIGAVLRSESGQILGEIAMGIGVTTNNVAEYTALIEGLEMALEKGVTEIDACVDSPVVIGHLLMGHKIKAEHLSPLIERALRLFEGFSTWSLERVPRDRNAHADMLANRGIDNAVNRSLSLPE
jgi:ribonuclease HI